MSTCTSSTNGVKSRQPRHCCLCGGRIAVGESHDTRTGVVPGDGFWTMRMHPECHRYEQVPGIVDLDWYQDVSDPAFERADAHRHEELQLS